jgi:hypothetical protein
VSTKYHCFHGLGAATKWFMVSVCHLLHFFEASQSSVNLCSSCALTIKITYIGLWDYYLEIEILLANC